MSQEIFIEQAQRAIFIAAILGGPALLISLLIGLVISIFQAVTQINEATLTFIPKIIAVGGALIVLGPWMLVTLLDYTGTILVNLPRFGR